MQAVTIVIGIRFFKRTDSTYLSKRKATEKITAEFSLGSLDKVWIR